MERYPEHSAGLPRMTWALKQNQPFKVEATIVDSNAGIRTPPM